MAVSNDSLREFLEHKKQKNAFILSPEGMNIDVVVAEKSKRLFGLFVDLTIVFILVSILFILAFIAIQSSKNAVSSETMLLSTLFFLLIFLIRNFYFSYFEIKWQGRTPGKKLAGTRVISAKGGELMPSAILARNLMREIEIFLPINIILSFGGWGSLAGLGWVLLIAAIPFFNQYNLRAGDVIAGTLVINMPKHYLFEDLSIIASEIRENKYQFGDAHLAKYGNFELHVLEEIVRGFGNKSNFRVMRSVCDKICVKIGWNEYISDNNVIIFLTDFYTAEREFLERNQLFGKIKTDKFDNSYKDNF